jgi:hypothetical protein
MTAILEHDPDYELLQQLKECPDFECLPLPQTWCKKYNLKTVYPESIAESKSHNYVNKCKFYNYAPIIIDGPQRDKDGKIILAPVAPPEDIPVEVTQKPFDSNNTNLVGLMALPWTATATESVSGVSAQ